MTGLATAELCKSLVFSRNTPCERDDFGSTGCCATLSFCGEDPKREDLSFTASFNSSEISRTETFIHCS